MKVTILSHDLSGNSLGRAYLLAEMLERSHKTEIVGPILGDDIWEPLRHRRAYKGIQTDGRIYNFGRVLPQLRSRISGDIIYAIKPRATSYGVGLLEKALSDKPLILDIDDWETGFEYNEHSLIFDYILGIPKLVNFNTYYYTRLAESVVNIADAKTVSNTFLQKKFGGELIPHARNESEFNPNKFNQLSVRSKFGLPVEKTIVMFLGTPRPHKGVADLVQAINLVKEKDVIGVIVGAHESKYTQKLLDIAGDSVFIYPPQPFDDIPAWIAASDIICIPQRESSSTAGQIPVKLFDAMMMGKPVIATNVSDIPDILGDCGIVVPPSDPEAIARNISRLANNFGELETLGNCARKRAKDRFSYDAVAPTLDNIVNNL